MSMNEFISSLEGVVTVFEHNNEIKTLPKILSNYYDFKEELEKLYSIDYSNVEASYEDENGLFRPIINQETYYESIRWVDGIRLYIKVEFDDKNIKKKIPESIPFQPIFVNNGRPWSCKVCQTRNDGEAEKCKICRSARS